MSDEASQYEDKAVFVPSQTNGLINGITGLLSKAADTAIDIWGLKEKSKVIGTVYPTGQVNPAAAQEQKVTNEKIAPNYTPYYIGGAVLLVVLVTVVVASKK